MASGRHWYNPYIAGRALGRARDFFDREDIIRVVETGLFSQEQNALVLFGQRRIGKTSLLLQLKQRLSSQPFLPVYIELMDKARLSLGQVLFEIAQAIACEVGMPLGEPQQFDDQGRYFRRTFLPALYDLLGENRNPVLLFDEFDVLDDTASQHLPSTAAAQAFLPYLRELLGAEPRLKFIFALGRRAEDSSINMKATFRTSLYQRVSVLNESSARELIKVAERQGSLAFVPAAVDRILALTNCHPYFIQLLCQILWNDSYACNPAHVPLIDIAAVECAAQRTLEQGQNVFEWIWSGLPPAEQVIFAAIATVADACSMVTEEQLIQVLQAHGARIVTRELELAPHMLVEWEMLRQVDGGYQFFVELMRQWVATYKPLPKVKEELERIVPEADKLYKTGYGLYKERKPENAEDHLRRALFYNPNHLKARLLLGEILLEQGAFDRAISELEEAYRYDHNAVRYTLIRALLLSGAHAERLEDDQTALMHYARVLDLSPQDREAQERRSAIWGRRGRTYVLG